MFVFHKMTTSFEAVKMWYLEEQILEVKLSVLTEKLILCQVISGFSRYTSYRWFVNLSYLNSKYRLKWLNGTPPLPSINNQSVIYITPTDCYPEVPLHPSSQSLQILSSGEPHAETVEETTGEGEFLCIFWRLSLFLQGSLIINLLMFGGYQTMQIYHIDFEAFPLC